MQAFTNAPPTTLSGNGGSINNSTLTIKVASVAGAPASGEFDILIGSEIIHIASQNGVDTFTVSASGRGAESTTAASHNDGDAVTYILTAAGLVRAVTDRLASYVPLTANIWNIVIAQNDQDVTSSTVLTDDTELRFDMDAGALYMFQLYMAYSSPAGAGTPDIKIAATGPATLTGNMVLLANYLSTADANGSAQAAVALTTGNAIGTAATPRLGSYHGWASSSGGGTGASGFRAQFAQNTSGGNPTRRLAGSVLLYRKMVP